MAELPDCLMLDNTAMNAIQNSNPRLSVVKNTGLKIHLVPHIYYEFTDISDAPDSIRNDISEQIKLVEDVASPEIDDPETIGGFDVDFDMGFNGRTGEIYDELVESHPCISEVDRPEAIAAEAAINRDIVFVTEDTGAQEKMRVCGYQEYLMTQDKFISLIDRRVES